MTLFTMLFDEEVSLAKDTKVIPAETFSKLLEMQDLIKKTQEDITSLYEENNQECEALRKKAKEKGHQEGLELFNDKIAHLDRTLREVKIQMQQKILPLALKAAKKIVAKELEIKPETIVDIVSQALKGACQAEQVKIYVAKDDLPFIEKKKDELKSMLDLANVFSIEERSDITQGSCMIETEAGVINASLENQFRALEAAFENFITKQ